VRCYLPAPFAGKEFSIFGVIVANTHSAEKQNRKAQKNRTRNAHVMSTLRSSVRKFREAAASGDADKTKQELASAVRQIAKAASKGVIHKGQAARRISRLTKAATGAQEVQAKT
jgi:small subunit ribosomal protein S20